MSETTGALAIRGDQLAFDEKQKNALLEISGLTAVDDATLMAFLHVCQKRGLDPFTRQIYIIGRYSTKLRREVFTVQTSIDGFRIISQRSHQYAGMTKTEWCGADGAWRDVWLEGKDNPPAAARVGVLRNGFKEPLYAVAVTSSYMPMYEDKTGKLVPMGLWRTMPEVMIAKCAEALARRQAFPEDLSGLYTDDEMEQAVVEEGKEEAKQTERAKDKDATKKVEPIVDAVIVANEEEAVELKKVLAEIFTVETIIELTAIFQANFARRGVVIPLEDGETTTVENACFTRRTQIEEAEKAKDNG